MLGGILGTPVRNEAERIIKLSAN